MGLEDDISVEADRLLTEAPRQDVLVRLLGGLAIHAQTRGRLPPALVRTYMDIDVVIGKGQDKRAVRFFESMGYEPNERFNASAEGRLLFYDRARGRRVDVFVGAFRMCHSVPLAGRLEVEPLTIPIAELLLTKLQIVKLNAKDVLDICSLFLVFDVGQADDQQINGVRVARVCAQDWGLWRTSLSTLEEVRARARDLDIPAGGRVRIAAGVDDLTARIEAEPKSLRWKTRSRLGDRVKWYEDPDEIEDDL